jgi:hypothetical protein
MADDNCGIDPCKPGPGNVPVDEASYMCSLGVRLQGTLDRARRINHRLGMRPYRVTLVWQERARPRDWREVYRLELTPVRVIDMTEVGRDLGESGNYANGSIRLTEVSPAQVSENILRGQLPAGVQWGAETHDREFFFEVQRYRRCVGDAEPPRHRFVLGSEVHHDGEQMFYSFVLVAQQVPRGPGGVDKSLALKPPKGGTVIVS